MKNGGAKKLILASASTTRIEILRHAGLLFEAVPAAIDERSVEAPLREASADAADIAEVLAQAKADEVAARHRDSYVIGCDQILSLEGELLHKPADMEAARRRLLQLSGKTHQLHTAACIHLNEDCAWSTMVTCNIKFRPLDPGFVGRHLAVVGDAALASVGAYQIEGPGIQLVDSYEGDFFSILGVPLLPLLSQLRALGVTDA